MYKGQQVTVSEHATNIALIEVANPPVGRIDDTTESELVDALALVNKTSRLNVIVITGGQPGVFMQHYDTLVLESRARQMRARGLRFDPDNPVPEVGIHRALREIEESSNTFIAAINGTAIGTGYELALACDLRLAQSGDYQIGLPEVHLGLLPGVGGTQRLTELVGKAAALELLLLGDTLDPASARRYGLVNDVVDGSVLDTALQLAQVLAEKPALARAHIKRLIRGVGKREDGMADERTLFCDLLVNKETLQRLEQVNGLPQAQRDASQLTDNDQLSDAA